MRFRLTYEGELRATQGEPRDGQRAPLAEHKQSIRKIFHAQLKQLWQVNSFLSDHRVHKDEFKVRPGIIPKMIGRLGYDWGPDSSLVDHVASNFQNNGYRFAPLVCEEFSLLCTLNILFLRADHELGVISAGDLDNRVKTLIDTLRMPKNANELRGNETPAEGEDPFFCLLEDDDLVTGLTVEADTLFDPKAAKSDVKLVISVELKPDGVSMFNLGFV
jgi:hypothetical protein